jgi:hypothetical protein
MSRAKVKTAAGTLPRWQREVLGMGFPTLSCFQDWRGWRDSAEAQAIWKAHSAELLKGCQGHRPRAWWVFTKRRKVPRPWWGEFLELKRMRVLAAGEDAGFEAAHAELQPNQPATEPAESKWATLGWVRIAYRAESAGTLAENVAENEFIAAWHRRRKRLALAEKYQKRAEALCRILEERQRAEAPGAVPEPSVGGTIQ